MIGAPKQGGGIGFGMRPGESLVKNQGRFSMIFESAVLFLFDFTGGPGVQSAVFSEERPGIGFSPRFLQNNQANGAIEGVV